ELGKQFTFGLMGRAGFESLSELFDAYEEKRKRLEYTDPGRGRASAGTGPGRRRLKPTLQAEARATKGGPRRLTDG
ncbi:MAG: hypothetical protein ABSD27_12355, partial [Bryobacteraceae bacterium]